MDARLLDVLHDAADYRTRIRISPTVRPHEDYMADLATLANIAEILGALTIVGGVVFAVVQIREFRVQRREAVAVELIRSFHDPQLAHAVNLIRELPDGVSAEELRSKGPKYERAAIMISTTYETIAFLVFRQMTSFSMVRELTGLTTMSGRQWSTSLISR